MHFTDAPGAKIINRTVFYKIKHKNDGTLKLKAIITFHDNEDDIKDNLTKACSSCVSTEIGTVQPSASFMGCKVVLGAVNGAFRKTRDVGRVIYVRAPQERIFRSTNVWILTVLAYRFVNVNARSQHKSERALTKLGL